MLRIFFVKPSCNLCPFTFNYCQLVFRPGRIIHVTVLIIHFSALPLANLNWFRSYSGQQLIFRPMALNFFGEANRIQKRAYRRHVSIAKYDRQIIFLPQLYMMLIYRSRECKNDRFNRWWFIMQPRLNVNLELKWTWL